MGGRVSSSRQRRASSSGGPLQSERSRVPPGRTRALRLPTATAAAHAARSTGANTHNATLPAHLASSFAGQPSWPWPGLASPPSHTHPHTHSLFSSLMLPAHLARRFAARPSWPWPGPASPLPGRAPWGPALAARPCRQRQGSNSSFVNTSLRRTLTDQSFNFRFLEFKYWQA